MIDFEQIILRQTACASDAVCFDSTENGSISLARHIKTIAIIQNNMRIASAYSNEVSRMLGYSVTAYLVGSAASTNFDLENSDIDITFIAKHQLSERQILMIRYAGHAFELALKWSCPFDPAFYTKKTINAPDAIIPRILIHEHSILVCGTDIREAIVKASTLEVSNHLSMMFEKAHHNYLTALSLLQDQELNTRSIRMLAKNAIRMIYLHQYRLPCVGACATELARKLLRGYHSENRNHAIRACISAIHNPAMINSEHFINQLKLEIPHGYR
jgi:predicted nucleotidyltransferase